MNAQQLSAAIGCRLTRAALWAPHLTEAMAAYEITTPHRQAMFLAQIGHESGGLQYVKELWGPTPTQLRYEFRADLGNTELGDGSKYRGRGLIQITGRANYARCGEALGLPLITHPEYLEQAKYAALSAAWFWATHGLNPIADRGDLRAATRVINGGLNGQPERARLYESAKAALSDV